MIELSDRNSGMEAFADKLQQPKATAMFPRNIKFAITLIGTSLPAMTAAEAPSEANTAERFSILITYGDDECPEAEGDEIVVCAQRPESERYRIPKELREIKNSETGEQSWNSVVASHDEAARPGRPSSCSVVGSFGFSGCQSAIMRQWFDERRNNGQ